MTRSFGERPAAARTGDAGHGEDEAHRHGDRRPAPPIATPKEPPEFRRARSRMVAVLTARGIADERVLALMGELPRHLFAPEGLGEQAYGDHALPVGEGQTLTQPFTVALCAQEVRASGASRVLEVGTGSGYQCALLARLCRQVFSVERSARLASLARSNLDRLGVTNAALLRGDGTIGWARFAPYDAIVVGAAAAAVPRALLEQLAPGGRLLIPLEEGGAQQLVRVTRGPHGERRDSLGPCAFVPLIGRA